MRAFALLLLAAGTASADGFVPPVARPYRAPRSLRVTTEGVVVRQRPDVSAERRGLLAKGGFVPYMGEARGPGCEAPWYRVDPQGYACGDLLEPSLEPARAEARPVVPEGELMPFPYGYARMDGARVYRNADDVVADDWDHELDPGFGVALDRPVVVDRRRMWLTRRGNLVPAGEVAVARPSEFTGTTFAGPQAPPLAWVKVRETFAHSRPGRSGRAAAAQVLGRHAVVSVLEERRTSLRIGPDLWVNARDFRRWTKTARPPDVGADERWIDVDRTEQVLTAYEGDVPVFATLVSTGRALRSTPAGEHRIWVKLATSHMDNFEEEEADELYSLEDVPWVMYFSEGVAIHGTFWHDRFGERHSHGCVNVSVGDARWLYAWTLPIVPAGWTAVFPTTRTPSTTVVVR